MEGKEVKLFAILFLFRVGVHDGPFRLQGWPLTSLLHKAADVFVADLIWILGRRGPPRVVIRGGLAKQTCLPSSELVHKSIPTPQPGMDLTERNLHTL